jgi:AraC-like DNA-binding protein
MKYFAIQPKPSLARYVRCFWVYEGEASEAAPYIYRGFADGCTELVFHYRGPFDRVLPDEACETSIAAGIHAQTRKYTRWIVRQDWSIFGCYIYPYAIPRIFGFPANDLTDELTDLQSLLGRRGRELEERIMSAKDTASRIAILTAFFESRLDRDRRELPPVAASIDQVLGQKGLVDVRHIARSWYMSDRTFERRFKEFSGFGPKLYSRIARFQATLDYYGSGKPLTDIAYECGYYDQSHFINDFKEFSGYSPKVYFSGQAEGSDYLEP